MREPEPPRRPTPEPDHEHEEHAPAPQYGHDDDSPVKEVVLADEREANPPVDDPDPVTWELPGGQLGEDVAAVVGVRAVAAGRIQWCDAGDSDFRIGERVVVDTERGQRVATVATSTTRRNVRDRNLRRVIRRAHEQDERGGESAARELRIAKDVAVSCGLPLKVFRVEKASGKLFVYYTSDEQRLDVRDFVSELARQTAARIELRQLGARDEAKQVGGIGSCGLTLCCTTWLPEFVPVSIKMAKDQGLVLSPTKVAGQCGRLKCCLVYEQAAYAEMRKGLPKLGKRVISARGEGRVVEVDVLRQRVRVSYAPGDSEVLPASEVRPMFPSGNQPGREPEAEPDPEPEPEPDLES
jgi:cell fate regulator YaaT (PSP1 superfamily)